MPTSTARLGLPVPVSTDPANVPQDMLNLANGLDGGSNANYSGAVVMIATPGAIGALPASPIVGTIYPVNSSPPYLLYYTGEATPGTGTAPTGWRLVGQVGSNTANISNTSPGNSVSAGTQPVWAPLDHRHSSLPWSSGQTWAAYNGHVASDGAANAFARADHNHGPVINQPASIVFQQSYTGPLNITILPGTPQFIYTSGSFTAPPSGSVQVECSFYVIAASNSVFTGTFNGSILLSGVPQVFQSLLSVAGNSAEVGNRVRFSTVITGLVPGDPITAHLGGIADSALSFAEVFVDDGSTVTSHGPLLMTIYGL